MFVKIKNDPDEEESENWIQYVLEFRDTPFNIRHYAMSFPRDVPEAEIKHYIDGFLEVNGFEKIEEDRWIGKGGLTTVKVTKKETYC